MHGYHNPYNPHALYPPPPPPPPDDPEETPSKSLRHLQFSAELLIFGFVGWSLLAVREYLGSTPVMDVTVVLSTMVMSLLNAVGAVLCSDAAAFAPFAQAYFSHSLALIVFYGYSLSESIVIKSPAINCNVWTNQSGGNNSVVSGTLAGIYKEAYFGGLVMHQVFASVTLGYLIVVFLVSAAQARVCVPEPRYWFLRGTSQCAAALVAMHLTLFSLHAPLEKTLPYFSYILCALVVAQVLIVVDLVWLGAVIWPAQSADARWRLIVISGVVEIGFLALISSLCNAFAVVIGGGQLSGPLFTALTLLILLWAVLFWNEMTRLYENDENKGRGAEAEDAAAVQPVIEMAPSATHATGGAATMRARRASVYAPAWRGQPPPSPALAHGVSFRGFLSSKGRGHHGKDK